MTIKEEHEESRKLNIPKAEGHQEIEGPQIENPDITALLKTRQVKIGIEADLKFSKIGDYWDDAIVDKAIGCFVNTRTCSLRSSQTQRG